MRSPGARAVHELTRFSGDFATRLDLGRTPSARLAIVIEEIVTNAVEHGRLGMEELAELTLAREAGGVRIILREPGRSFDPRTGTSAWQDRAMRGGGAGLDLVRAWTRIVDYETADGINRLELILPLDAGQGEG